MFIIDKDDFIMHEDTIDLCDCLFMCINDRFGSKYRKPVSVLGDKGNLLFNVVWESEYYYPLNDTKCGFLPFQCNFYGQDLTENIDKLDLYFISQMNGLCFESINEYSWHITRLVNTYFPDKKVFFLDENICFFHDISCSEKTVSEKNVPLFRSGHLLPEEDNVYSIYSLMISLTWVYKRHYNNSYECDDTVLIIDFCNEYMGFGDMVRICSAFVSAAKLHGWIPFICMDTPTQYADYQGEDCWSKFFVPISSIAKNDLYRYKCWISVSENRSHEWFFPINSNPYINKFALESLSRFPVKLNERTLIYAENKIPQQVFKEERILGVIIRTTDYENGTSHKTDPYAAIEAVKSWFSLNAYSYVFLATEDERILGLFREVFGDHLLYVKQKRVDPDPEKDSVLLCHRFSELYDSKYEQGADYLSVLYALTACSDILFNHNAGTVYVATNLYTRINERIPSVFNFTHSAFHSMKQLIVDTMEYITAREPSAVIIYGAGNNGKSLCFNIRNLCPVKYFCDRTAEQGEYEYEGCRVVSPDTLKEVYNGELVVITPYSRKEEIEKKLISIGIPQDHIIK